MQRFSPITAVPISLALGLAGCGGGGGGGTVKDVNFTDFASLSGAANVHVDALTQETQYTFSGSGLTGLSATSTPTTASSATLSMNAAGDITGVVLDTPLTDLAITASSGADVGTSDPLVFGIGASDETAFFAIDPTSALIGWNYQTFGVWLSEDAGGNGSLGSFSVGAPTVGASIPTTGVATFTGGSLGWYINSAGTDLGVVIADLDATVDFGARSVAIQTTGTQMVTVDPVTDTVTTVSASNLDISGTLGYSAGDNAFSGSVTSAGGMTGSSDGRFYGPNAEELGGVYSLTGSGYEHFSGSYGAKQ